MSTRASLDDWIAAYYLDVFLRTERIPYDRNMASYWKAKQKLAAKRLAESGERDVVSVARAFASATRELESGFQRARQAYLSQLSFDDLYRVLLTTATAFHEGLHFHQVTGTTCGRALFELFHQVAQKRHALALLSLGRPTTNLWPTTRGLTAQQCQDELLAATESIGYILGDAQATDQPTEDPTALFGFRPFGGHHVVGLVPTIQLRNVSYPIGARSIMEGWAYSLSCMVLTEMGGADCKTRYAREKKASQSWEYWLLSDVVDSCLGDAIRDCNLLDRYTLIARIAFFSLQVGFPISSRQYMVVPQYLETPGNLPAFRLVTLLKAMRDEPGTAWRARNILTHLDSLMTQVETVLHTSAHSEATTLSAAQLSNQIASELEQLPKDSADSIQYWALRQYAAYHERMGHVQEALFDYNTWIMRWNRRELPWPLLQRFSWESEPGQIEDVLGMDLLQGTSDDVRAALVWLVLCDIVDFAFRHGEVPTDCPLKVRRLPLECSRKDNPCQGPTQYVGCPFEEALSMV